MKHTARPGYISVYVTQNPPCFSTCAILADTLTSTAQEGNTEPGHGFSYFPPNPDWVHKNLDTKWVADINSKNDTEFVLASRTSKQPIHNSLLFFLLPLNQESLS